MNVVGAGILRYGVYAGDYKHSVNPCKTDKDPLCHVRNTTSSILFSHGLKHLGTRLNNKDKEQIKKEAEPCMERSLRMEMTYPREIPGYCLHYSSPKL